MMKSCPPTLISCTTSTFSLYVKLLKHQPKLRSCFHSFSFLVLRGTFPFTCSPAHLLTSPACCSPTCQIGCAMPWPCCSVLHQAPTHATCSSMVCPATNAFTMPSFCPPPAIPLKSFFFFFLSLVPLILLLPSPLFFFFFCFDKHWWVLMAQCVCLCVVLSPPHCNRLRCSTHSAVSVPSAGDHKPRAPL